MSKPFYTDGMTVNQIVNLPFNVVNNMSKRDLSHAVRTVALASNKRVNHLDKRAKTVGDISTGALNMAKKHGQYGAHGKDRNELLSEFQHASKFINSTTSTIKGAKENRTNKLHKALKTQGVDNPAEHIESDRKRAVKQALKQARDEKKRKNKKIKDLRKVKLTEKQKEKVRKKALKEFDKALNKKTSDVFTLLNKFKESTKNNMLEFGVITSNKALELIKQEYDKDPNIPTTELMDNLAEQLTNEYERQQLERLEEEQAIRNSFATDGVTLF